MSKNQTERSLEEKSKKPRYLYHFPLIICAYIIVATLITYINEEVYAREVLFIELPIIFILLLIASFSRKGRYLFAMIFCFIIIFTIPFNFIMNHRYQLEIDTSDEVNNNLQTANGKTFFLNEKACRRVEPSVNRKIACTIFINHISPIVINGNKQISGYSGRDFNKKYKYTDDIYEKDVTVFYKKTKLHDSVVFSLWSNIYYIFNDNSYNLSVIYKINATDKTIPENYFINQYKKNKKAYIILSVIYLINALIFSMIIYMIYKRNINKS